MTPRLKTKYDNEMIKNLIEEFKYENVHEVPKVVKVVLNMGLGAAVQNPKIIESAQKELSTIAVQHAIVTRARRSIATFKLREGMPIGCSVTLRRKKNVGVFRSPHQRLSSSCKRFSGDQPQRL